MRVLSQNALDLELFLPKFCLIENSNEYMGSKAINKKLIVFFYVLKTTSIWVPKCISKESLLHLTSNLCLMISHKIWYGHKIEEESGGWGSRESVCLLVCGYISEQEVY